VTSIKAEGKYDRHIHTPTGGGGTSQLGFLPSPSLPAPPNALPWRLIIWKTLARILAEKLLIMNYWGLDKEYVPWTLLADPE